MISKLTKKFGIWLCFPTASILAIIILTVVAGFCWSWEPRLMSERWCTKCHDFQARWSERNDTEVAQAFGHPDLLFPAQEDEANNKPWCEGWNYVGKDVYFEIRYSDRKVLTARTTDHDHEHLEDSLAQN